MKVKILGYTNGDFQGQNGETIPGWNIFYSVREIKNYGAGIETARSWVKAGAIVGKLELGEADMDFNNRGKVQAVTMVK